MPGNVITSYHPPNIGVIFIFIPNGIYLLLSHWLIIFQSIVLQADWLILDNNEKGTLHMDTSYQGELR